MENAISTSGLPEPDKDLEWYQKYFRALEESGKGIDVDLGWIRYKQGWALRHAREACKATKLKGAWNKFITTALNISYPTVYNYVRVATEIPPDQAAGKSWTELLGIVYPHSIGKQSRKVDGYETDEEKKPATIAKAASSSKKSQNSKDLEESEDDDIDEDDFDEDEYDSESSNGESVKFCHAIEAAPSVDPGEPQSRGIQFPATNPQACSGWLDAVIADIANAYAMAKDCPESERDACKAKVNVALANLEKVTRRLDDPTYSAELSVA